MRQASEQNIVTKRCKLYHPRSKIRHTLQHLCKVCCIYPPKTVSKATVMMPQETLIIDILLHYDFEVYIVETCEISTDLNSG